MCEDSVHKLNLVLADSLVLFVGQGPDSVVLVVQHGGGVVSLLDGLWRDNDVEKLAVELVLECADRLEVIHYFQEACIFGDVSQVLAHAVCELNSIDEEALKHHSTLSTLVLHENR